MNEPAPDPSQLSAAAKSRWRWFCVARWFTQILLIVGFLITAIALIGVVVFVLTLDPQRPVGAELALVFVAPIGALVGGWFIMRRIDRRIARAWGMFCENCHTAFEYDAYQFALVRGECYHCLRRKQANEALIADNGMIASRSADPSNPYAPPLAETAAAPPPPQPQRVIRLDRWNGKINYALGLIIVGWLGPILMVRGWIQMEWGNYDGPPWLQNVVAHIRRTNRKYEFIIAGIWLVAFCAGMTAELLLLSDNDVIFHVIASHFVCGVALTIAAFPFLKQTPAQRELGVPAPYSPQTNSCEVLLLPFDSWRETPAAVQFRTQGPEGITLLVRHTLSAETLLVMTCPRTNPDGWTEFLLPLDAPAFMTYPTDQVEVKARSLDNKPWLVRYERTPPPA